MKPRCLKSKRRRILLGKRGHTIIVRGLALATACAIFCSCSKKPDGPGLPYDDPSADLLKTPVFSPIDTSIYYFDSGASREYFEEFKRNGHAVFVQEIQPGIYRVPLYGDDRAELVLPNAILPRISPDGSTMYCIRGAGEIWRMALPNGTPELIKSLDFTSVSRYGLDTLLVMRLADGINLYDVRKDSLIWLGISGGYPDASIEKKIVHVWGMDVYAFDATGDWLVRPANGMSIRGIRWSPDGQEFVFSGVDSHSYPEERSPGR